MTLLLRISMVTEWSLKPSKCLSKCGTDKFIRLSLLKSRLPKLECHFVDFFFCAITTPQIIKPAAKHCVHPNFSPSKTPQATATKVIK